MASHHPQENLQGKEHCHYLQWIIYEVQKIYDYIPEYLVFQKWTLTSDEKCKHPVYDKSIFAYVHICETMPRGNGTMKVETGMF